MPDDDGIDLRTGITPLKPSADAVAVAPQPPTRDADLRTGITPVLDTSFSRVPSNAGDGSEWGTGNVSAVRSAFGEGYRNTGAPSVTREGIRSVLAPETQRSLANTWYGPALNVVGDVVGTGLADVAGAANSVYTLGNEALKSIGVPAPLIRDINVQATQAPVAPELRPFWTSPNYRAAVTDAPAMRELTTPVTPSLSQVFQRQRAATPPDAVTQAVISLLQQSKANQGVNMPPPPTPFTTPSAGGLLASQPAPQLPAGGLLGPRGAAPTMTADEMLARAQGYYSPADKLAAQGAVLTPAQSDAIRKPLTDAVPTDPERSAYTGDTALVQMGKAAQKYSGQPMSYDTAMALDREIGGRIKVALRAGDDTLAGQLGDAQDAIRDQMAQLPALDQHALARQAYSQYVKRSQIDDIAYRASLRPDDKQDAYIRSQMTTMLGNEKKMRGWTDDERAAAEDVAKSGNLGAVSRLGLSLIKPAAQGVGGYLGSGFGPGGTIVGSTIGGELGTSAEARLRGYLTRTTLDPVMQQIARGVPPIPPQPQ